MPLIAWSMSSVNSISSGSSAATGRAAAARALFRPTGSSMRRARMMPRTQLLSD
jgi:hypothetical protein